MTDLVEKGPENQARQSREDATSGSEAGAEALQTAIIAAVEKQAATIAQIAAKMVVSCPRGGP